MARWLTIASAVTLTLCVLAPASAQTTGPDEGAGKPAGRYSEPEPSVIPVSWQLDIRILKVGRIVLNQDQGSGQTYYWYVIYSVVNPSNRTVDLMPRITMLTDNLDVHQAMLALSPDLFKLIKETTRSKYLEEPLQVSRVIGGSDNARDSVAVFALKGDPKWFRVFFSGFSGEQRKMTVPGKQPGTTEEVVLEKIWTVEYNVPGNTPADRIPPVHMVPGSGKWAMRLMPPQTKYVIDLKNYPNPIRADDGSEKPAPEQPKTPEPAPAPPAAAPEPAPQK